MFVCKSVSKYLAESFQVIIKVLVMSLSLLEKGVLPFLQLAKVQWLCFWQVDLNDCEFGKIFIGADKNTVLLSFVHPAFIR